MVWCVCGVCGARDLENDVSVQARFYMHLIGWQNAWERAPGRPRHPFPALMAEVWCLVCMCVESVRALVCAVWYMC